MLGTKFSAMAMAAVRIAAAGAVGTAALAGAVLIVGPALPEHRIEPWVSTQPQNLAFVTGLNHCHAAARRLRDFGTPIPPECANSGWNAYVNPPPPGEDPPPDDGPSAP
jgi:hypothetical protein